VFGVVAGREHAADAPRSVENQDAVAARGVAVRVQSHQVVQLDVQPCFLFGFAHGRNLGRLVVLDEAARQAPQVHTRVHPATDEQYASILFQKDARADLRVAEEDIAAGLAVLALPPKLLFVRQARAAAAGAEARAVGTWSGAW